MLRGEFVHWRFIPSNCDSAFALIKKGSTLSVCSWVLHMGTLKWGSTKVSKCSFHTLALYSGQEVLNS